jgi:hypothetical protein
MTGPESNNVPTRERGGKVWDNVWRRLYRFSERLYACGECAVVVFVVWLFLMIVLGVLI